MNTLSIALQFHVNYTLVQSEPRWSEEGPLPSLEALPVLNATQATRQFEATLLRDCGADDICESDISISAVLALPIGKMIYFVSSQQNIFYILAQKGSKYYA